MTTLQPGQQVRIAPVPSDHPWNVDTGTVIRMQQVHDPSTGRDGDSTTWLIDLDRSHFERAIPRDHLTLIDPRSVTHPDGMQDVIGVPPAVMPLHLTGTVRRDHAHVYLEAQLDEGWQIPLHHRLTETAANRDIVGNDIDDHVGHLVMVTGRPHYLVDRHAVCFVVDCVEVVG